MTQATYSFDTEDGETMEYEISYIAEVMNYITNSETGKKKYATKHAKIVKKHFNNKEFDWNAAIDHWDVEEVEDAIEYFEDNQ